MKPKFLVILIKELREALRDRRTLGLLAMFVVMYPVIIGYALKMQVDRSTKPEREGIELVVIGAAQAPTLMAQLKQKNVTIKEHADMSESEIATLLKGQKVVGVLRLNEKFGDNYQSMRPARIELWFDSAADVGAKQREVEDVLHDYNNSIAGARLLAHGVSPVALAPIQLQRYDTATSASRSASVIGNVLGSLFIPAFIFCLSTAVDGTAGERERRSLEVLMAQPVLPRELILGKWLAAGLLSVIGVSLELIVAHFILKWLPLEEIGLSWRMSGLDLAAMCLASIPLSLFAAAFEIALAMNAKSFKEAQTTVSFAMLVPLLPIMVVPMLNLTTASWMYMVPVLSNQTLLRELSKGQDLGPLPFLMTAASSLLAALAAYAFSTWRMRSEKYVLSV